MVKWKVLAIFFFRIVRFRLGSARLDIEDPTNRHLGWVSYVSRACHALPKAKTNTGKDVEKRGNIKVFIAAYISDDSVNSRKNCTLSKR